MILQDYKTTEEAVEQAQHWIKNIICHYRLMGRSLKADGMQEALTVFEEHLKKVKTD